MSNRKSYSDEQLRIINQGISRGMPLLVIAQTEDFIAASKERDKFIASERETFRTQDYLAFGNDGPFASREEREAAFSHPLYHSSEAYRQAVAHKSAQTPDSIMGIHHPPDPLSPENLIRAAREDLYFAKRTELFDKAGSKDPVVAAQARLDILAFGTDPAYAELRAEFERTEAETKPYETWLKQQPGGVQIQTFPQGTEAEMQAEADRRNAENYEARPGGLGDGGVSGEATVTF